jgi:gephyrin
LPPEADAVISFENTRIISVLPTLPQEEAEVATLIPISKGENVRGPGSDVRKGDVVAKRGDVIRAGEIGSLVFVGRKDVSRLSNSNRHPY